MQDRFKFRIWNKLANMMTYNFMLGNYMQISKVDYEKKDWVGVNYEPEYICFENEGIKNIEIMQSTGLKDKNGKLIYEGDIVKTITHNLYEEHIGVIRYHTCYFSLDYKEVGKFGECGISLTKNTSDFVALEMLGNIYETPELIGGAK